MVDDVDSSSDSQSEAKTISLVVQRDRRRSTLRHSLTSINNREEKLIILQ